LTITLAAHEGRESKMSTDAVHLDRPTGPQEPSRNLRRWWGAVAALLVAGIFIQAVLAGAMLSGVGWARPAHALAAAVLTASTIAAGLVAVVVLRRTPHGPKLALTLLGLAAAVFLQAAVGRLSAHGANLLWLHVPLGVALVGFAAQAAAAVRRLGGE
jgi:CHASE2 domain-containing sensor protein